MNPATHIPGEDPHVQATVDAVYSIFEQGRPLLLGSSAGKDSSVLVATAFTAALLAKKNGLHPIMAITTGDTLIDNPIMAPFARRELKKAQQYGQQHGIEIYTEITTPSFLMSFVGKVLSGKGLPTFPGTGNDCSTDYKISGQARARNAILKKIKAKNPHLKLGKNQPNEPVLILGVRKSESIARGANMERRGDSTNTPVRAKNSQGQEGKGGLVMASIGNWDTDQVWMYLLEHRDGQRTSYTDFVETDELYGDAGGGTTCGYKADVKFEEEELNSEQAKSQPCSARFGCFLCTAVGADRSVETMIAGDEEKYGFMRAGNKLRNWISATRWDWSRRHWIGRTISKDGENTITIEPDTYSPAMVLELYRYMLTIQYDEPRLTTITFEQAFALDLMWSLNAYHKPNTAINEYNEIMSGRARYDVPEVAYVPRTQYRQGKLKVKEQRWADHMIFGGLRSMEVEMVSFDVEHGMGCGSVKTTGSGQQIPDNIENELVFTVHRESYDMVSDFMPEDIEKLNDGSYTEGYRFWLRTGAISMNTNTSIDHDDMLCRAQWREMKGLAGQQDPEKLLAMCEPESIKWVGVDELAEKAAVAERKQKRLDKQAKAQVIRIYPKPATPEPTQAPSPANWAQMDLFA